MAIQSHINSEAECFRRAFGKRFCGIDTAWTDILAAIKWTQRMQEICGQRQVSERLVQWATLTGDQTPPVKGLVAHHANFEEKLSAMQSGFEDPEPTFHGVPLKGLPLAALLARLYEIRERIDALQPWTDFKRFAGQFESARLTGFLT